MRKIILIVVTLLVVLFSSECLAYQPAVIGGIRDGLALGLMAESSLSGSTALRF
jgi:hypothetical protein